MPPVIRPAATSIAPCQMIIVIAPNIMKIMKAVISARSRIRRFAVPNTRSTDSVKRLASRSCWPNACTIFIAPSTSLVTVPTSAMRSWLRREMARTWRATTAIGPTTSTAPATTKAASLGASANRMTTHTIASTRLRSMTETVVPTTCSMIVVSTVIREVISAGRFSSKKPGDRRSRLRWTARRMSATVRSPIHDTK